MKKYDLIDTISRGSGARREGITPDLIVADSGEYKRGDILDANSVKNIISQYGMSNFPGSAEYITRSELDTLLELNDGIYYGIKWTSLNVTPIRVGSAKMHKTLPIQSQMRRCMLADDGTVVGYINPEDPTKYTNNTPVDYSGSDGLCMVEIPQYYYLAFSTTENDITSYYLLLYPYKEIGKLSKKVYVSAFEASSDDADQDATTKKLYSICSTNMTVNNNAVAANTLTYTQNAAKYRGGSYRSNSTNDNTIKSLLGRPVTNLTRSQFRTRAENRGSGWSQLYWSAYESIVRLFVVEYCTFNSQAGFVATDPDSIYKLGGLGSGATNVNASLWGAYNAYNPLCPCGVTIPLCNNTGYINFTYAANEFSSSAVTIPVASYRGIENPFGNIWKWTDGINVNNVSGTIYVYTCDDITKFADDTTTNYTLRTSFIRPNAGFIKTWNWDENGDFIPETTGGSDSSYLCDYSWWPNGWRVVSLGGRADSGSKAGLFYFSAYDDSSLVNAYVGGRLYYTPQD